MEQFDIPHYGRGMPSGFSGLTRVPGPPKIWNVPPNSGFLFQVRIRGISMSNPIETTQIAEGKYVYCIIKSKEPRSFGPMGIGARSDEVYTVHYEDLAAVVSNTPIQVYDPTRENVLAHEQVNETVMREFTVLPMAFGALFRTSRTLPNFYVEREMLFRDVFTKMEGKLEFGLKVNWDRDKVIAEIEKHNEEIRNLKEQITTRSGSTYFARMQLGRLVEAALSEQADAYVREIYAELRNTAVASRANKTIGDR